MLSENRDMSLKRGFVSEEAMRTMRDALCFRKDDWTAQLRALKVDAWKNV